MDLASSLLLRGAAAIVEAYLIYWAVVWPRLLAMVRLRREWSVPLASGISICGVAAATATGGAIRARPAVPILVSSLVVVFAVVEVLILPFLAQTFLWQEPLVAGAWIGLAVKTDGAAVAGGGITEALITAKAAAEGIRYQPGWILATTTTVKIFIDIFIGVWAFILGYIWTNHIDKGPDKAKPSEIWQRFPKFILGFILVFAISLWLALRNDAGHRQGASRRGRRGQCLPGDLFHPDLLLDPACCRTSASSGNGALANSPRSISSACSDSSSGSDC